MAVELNRKTFCNDVPSDRPVTPPVMTVFQSWWRDLKVSKTGLCWFSDQCRNCHPMIGLSDPEARAPEVEVLLLVERTSKPMPYEVRLWDSRKHKRWLLFWQGLLSALSHRAHLPTHGGPCLFWGGDKTTCWVAQSLNQTLIDTCQRVQWHKTLSLLSRRHY